MFFNIVFIVLGINLTLLHAMEGAQRSDTFSSLKELCFKFGIKNWGYNFLNHFESVSSNSSKTSKDIEHDARIYYKKCCLELDDLFKKRYPSHLVHAPPAQPLNKVVEELYQNKCFHLLRIINERYYAPLKWPAITVLAGAGHLNSIKILHENGADINARDFFLRTPLLCAARNGHLEIVKYLVDKADLDCKDACNYDAIKHAQERNHNEIVQLIRAKKKEKNDK